MSTIRVRELVPGFLGFREPGAGDSGLARGPQPAVEITEPSHEGIELKR